MHFSSETELDGVTERAFALDVAGEQVPGLVWSASGASGSHPLLLLGHGGSQSKRFPPLVSRARRYVSAFGFAVAALDAPGHGERTPTDEGAKFVASIRAAMAENKPVADMVAREMTRLVRQTVPEWQAALDMLQSLDFIGAHERVGYWGLSMGGATGVPLVAAEPRINAAVLGLAGLLPGQDVLASAAAKISIPIEFVLQWGDELVSRESSLALFDAFGSKEKTLHANPGGHGRVSPLEEESWERFFCRHLQAKSNG
jgi:dienelactone hydrolase